MIGTLKIGAYGDVTILKLEEGRICKQRLIVTKVIKSGEIIF